MEIKPPAADVLNRVMWLGARDSSEELPIGSGVVVHVRGIEYLMTAHHVATECSFQPLVRYGNRWNEHTWEPIVKDKRNDLAVLKAKDVVLDSQAIPVLYGEPKGLVYGQLGYALGYPGLSDDDTKQVTEANGRPIPVPALVIATFFAGSSEIYSSGYINAGFSGGAVVFPVGDTWTIAGMIVNYPAILKPVLRKKGENRYEEEPGLYYEVHTGFVGYKRWSLVEKAINVADKG